MFSEQFIYEIRYSLAEILSTRFSVPISAQLISNMRKAVTAKNIPVTHIVCGSDVWPIIASDDTLRALITPTSDMEQVNIGFVATLFALPILCEGALPKDRRMLNSDSLVLAALDPKHSSTWSTDCPVLSVLDAVAASVSR